MVKPRGFPSPGFRFYTEPPTAKKGTSVKSTIPKGEPPRTPEIQPGQLSDEDRRELVEGSGISPEVIAARGYRTATRRLEVPATFPGWQRVPGLVVPTHSPAPGVEGCQLKPRRPIPRKGKKGPKYETPHHADVTLDANPLMLEEVRRGFSELWITEGCKKVDALASRGIPCVGLTGVEMFAVKDSHGTEPLACWRHVRLGGRPVVVVYDADARTNPDVQRALGRLVAMLEAIGAWVRVVYLPPVDGDTKAGVDDYLAAGGTVEELRGLARTFEPVDVGAERLSKDEELRAAVEGRREYLRDMRKVRPGELTLAAVVRVLTEEAPSSGTLTKDGGIRVVMDRRTLAERAGKSKGAVNRAVWNVPEDSETLRVDASPRPSDKAGAFVLPSVAQRCTHSGSKVVPGGKVLRGEENVSPLSNGVSDPGGYPNALPDADVPAMRFPRVILYRAMQDGRQVVADSHYLWRLGPKREEVLRYALASGGEWTPVKDLMDRFAGASTRPWDFRRRALLPLTGWREDPADPDPETGQRPRDPETGRPLKKLVRVGPALAELAERGGEWMLRPLPDAAENLEVYRRECLELEDAERQRDKHAEQRLTHRIKVLHRAGMSIEKIASRFGLPVEQVAGVVSPADPEAELMGKEKVREIVAEMREREVQPALSFVRDTLDRLGTVRLGLLSDMWREEGGEGFYLRLALRRLGCRARRHRDFPDQVFVRAPERWPDPEAINSATKKAGEDPAGNVLPMSKPVKDPGPSARPEKPRKPDTGNPRDVFRNNPHTRGRTMRNDEAAEAPRKMPPKVGGRFKHGPECGCWLCEDEPAESAPAGIGASA